MSDELEKVEEETKELELVNKNYDLVSVNKLASSAFKIRKDLMDIKTNPNYVDNKNGFPYVKSTYMDDTFKKLYPLHRIEIVNSGVVANCWIFFDVVIKAYLTPTIYISNSGTGGARIQIPKEFNDKAKALKASGEMDKRRDFLMSLSPTDWIDFGNDRKSALTKAIANAESKFGVAADIYNKGIITEEQKSFIMKAVDYVINEVIVSPMERMNVLQYWKELLLKKGNIVQFYISLAEKYEITEDSILEKLNK